MSLKQMGCMVLVMFPSGTINQLHVMILSSLFYSKRVLTPKVSLCRQTIEETHKLLLKDRPNGPDLKPKVKLFMNFFRNCFLKTRSLKLLGQRNRRNPRLIYISVTHFFFKIFRYIAIRKPHSCSLVNILKILQPS